MQYPARRHPHYTFWFARAGASLDTAPVPAKTADRCRAIRRVFLEDFAGRATLDDIGVRCDELGLLDDLSTDRSMREIVKRALRAVGTTRWSESAECAATVRPPLTLQEARDRLR